MYVKWKKEIKIWEAFTSVPEEKSAPAIFMTLTGEARKAILNVDIEKLTEKAGVNNLMVELDKMYLKDESSQAYEAYETFEQFVRPSGMSISDYVIKFEQLSGLYPERISYQLMGMGTQKMSPKDKKFNC